MLVFRKNLRTHLMGGLLSKTTENDLLSHIKDFIQSEIANDIQNQTEGPFFGIFANKVTSVSYWEHLGFVVRYVRLSSHRKTIRI